MSRRTAAKRTSTAKALKPWLLAALAVGLLAFSGGGTFSSFNAETINKTTSLASGTLTMSNRVNSGTICLSANATSTNNHNTSCSAVMSLQNIEPGEWNPLLQTAQVTIRNMGSLNASHFTLQAPNSTTGAPNCHGTYTTKSSTSVTVSAVKLTKTSATVTDTTGFSTVTPGMVIKGTKIPYSATSPTTVVAVYGKKLVMSKAATTTVSAGESVKFFTSVTVTPVAVSNTSTVLTHTGGFPTVAVGMFVTGTGIPTDTVVDKITGSTLTMSQAATATHSEKVTFGASYGSQINFAKNPATRPVCAKALLFVQESATVSGSTDYYCWYGSGSKGSTAGTAESGTKGLCVSPLSTILTTPFTCKSGTYTLKLGSRTGPVFTTDAITITNGASTCTVKATTGPYAPTYGTLAPSTAKVKVTWVSGSGTFPAGSTVSDSTTATSVNSAHTHYNGTYVFTYTIKNFDTVHGTAGPLRLYPISGAGTVSKTAAVRLGALSTRTFTIGLYLPAPTSTVQNTLQGLKTFFTLMWFIQE